MLSFHILFLIPLFLIYPHKLFSMQLGPGTASLACTRLIVSLAPFNGEETEELRWQKQKEEEKEFSRKLPREFTAKLLYK